MNMMGICFPIRFFWKFYIKNELCLSTVFGKTGCGRRFSSNGSKKYRTNPYDSKPQTFLDMLYTAYSIVVAGRGKHLIGKGTVIPLMELYQLLTLLPWLASEYTRQEFGRDVYLLDKSGAITTKNSHRTNVHASTGVRDVSKTLTVIAQGGREKTYYGIFFVKA